VNDPALRLYGYARDEFLALAYGDTLASVEEGGDALPPWGLSLSPTHCGAQRHVKKSGEEFLADVIAQDVVFEGRDARFMLIIEMADTARAEALLRQREALFSALVEHSPDVIARIDRELRHVYVSPAVVAATGVAAADLIGKTDRQLGVPLELCVRWAAGARRVFATGRQQDIEISHGTGETRRYYESRMVPELAADGQVESVLAIARDVTERKHAELGLRASERLLRRTNQEFEALADALPQLITGYDRELRHVYANAAVEGATGRPPSALLMLTHAEAGFSEELAALWDDCIERVFQSGRPVNLEYACETPEGPRVYEASHIPLLDDAGAVTGVLRVAYNITQRKKAEEERLATITRQRDAFVREVHHRVKNNLQGVVGLLRQLVNKDRTLSAVLEKAISQLMAMAVVHGVNGRELHDGVGVTEMVSEIAKSVERTTGIPVRVHSEASASNPRRVKANDAVPIALVLNELVLNAVKHRRIARDSAPATVHVEGDAQRVQISVTNEGMLSKHFDYDGGSGLGTGLELVRALVPTEGAGVAFSRDNGCVTATLTVSPPLLITTDDTLEQTRHEWDRRKRAYSDRRR
jgi:PAS domain S-box-containing protein